MTHTATLIKPRVYLLVAAGLMAIGALLHLVVVAVGADAYCRDAAVAVETAKDYMKRRHNARANA